MFATLREICNGVVRNSFKSQCLVGAIVYVRYRRWHGENAGTLSFVNTRVLSAPPRSPTPGTFTLAFQEISFSNLRFNNARTGAATFIDSKNIS